MSGIFGGGGSAPPPQPQPAPLPPSGPDADAGAEAERKRKAAEAQRRTTRGGLAGNIKAGGQMAREEQAERAKKKLGVE